MLAAIQFPICDCRPFLAAAEHTLHPQGWAESRSQPPKFLRGFGSVTKPQSFEDRAWVDEEFFCKADNAISLPFLEQRRLGDEGSDLIPTGAFYRLVYDRRAVAQVHLGVRHSAWAPAILNLGKRELLRIIEDFLKLPSRVGADSISPVVLQGSHLARRYFRATTPQTGTEPLARMQTLVDYGNPLVIFELESFECLELPVTELDSSKLGGVQAAFFRLRTQWGPVAVCIVKGDSAAPGAVRNVRLCLLRLHSEREALDLVLKQIKRGRIPAKADNPNLDLDTYLNQSTRIVAQDQKYGIAQSAIRAAFESAVSVRNLDSLYEGIRPQILRKTREYDSERGHTRVVTTWSSGGAQAPLLSGQDTVIAGASLSEINQSELYWNTRFPRDAAANVSKAIFATIDYLLETGIETLADRGGLSTLNVDPEKLAAQGDGKANLTFRISADGEVLRNAGDGDKPWTRSIVSPSLPCVAGIGTPRFPFLVRAPDAGTIGLELAVIMRNSIVLTQTLPLRVIGLAVPAGTAQTRPDGDPGAEPPAPTIEEPLGTISLERETPTETIIEVNKTIADGREWLSVEISRGDRLAPFNSAKDAASINTYIILMRKKLVELSRQYQPLSAIDGNSGDDAFAIVGPQDAMLEFAKLGFRLHEAVFGSPFEEQGERWKAATMLARLGRTRAARIPFVQIFSANVPIPWALMYDAGAYAFASEGKPSKRYLKEPERLEDVDPNCFWGARWAMYRTIRLQKCADEIASGPGNGSIVACVNPYLDKEIEEKSRQTPKSSVVENQKAFFLKLSSPSKFVESREQFGAFLSDDEVNRCKLLYFFCHAEAAHTLAENMLATATISDEAANIRLDDRFADKKMSIKWMMNAADDAMLSKASDLKSLAFSMKNRPLVFMNTCSSAEGDVAYPSPFIEHFKSKWGASGFVGTDWKIPTVFADLFGRRVLDRVLRQKAPILRAFQQVTLAAIRKGNPFGLIYGIYASPDCALYEIPAPGR